MSDLIRLKSDSLPRPRRHPLLWVLVFVLLGVLASLLIERWRGQWALARWKHRMAARGEVFDATRIWPKPAREAFAFSNQLSSVVSHLPEGLNRYAGRISAIAPEAPGLSRRGSQEPNPVLAYDKGATNTWENLATLVREAEPSLACLRRMLADPPSNMGYDVLPALESLNCPNFVGARRAAQALQAAAVSELHRGNLPLAKDNLVALANYTKVYADDPTLLNYMIRMAVLGLAIEPGWDALQADGWTDDQLAELQQAFSCDQLLRQLTVPAEAQRAARLIEFDWFACHSYREWVDRYEEIYQSFGQKPPVTKGVIVTRLWREWVFHPLWKFAWADQEKLAYLENAQRELEVLRAAVKTGSWKQLNRDLQAFQASYRSPAARWRFYLILPWADQVREGFGGNVRRDEYPYAMFNRAWLTSMKNITLCQMLTTAIGLKRYELRHGKPAAGLEALVPEILAQLPRDLMDGEPLRYRIGSDGLYCLYSVAENAQDDRGNAAPNGDGSPWASPWNGLDWVWPQAVRRTAAADRRNISDFVVTQE